MKRVNKDIVKKQQEVTEFDNTPSRKSLEGKDSSLNLKMYSNLLPE